LLWYPGGPTITQHQVFNEVLEQSITTPETSYQSTGLPNPNRCAIQTTNSSIDVLPSGFAQRTGYQLQHSTKPTPPHLWTPVDLTLETGVTDCPILRSKRSPSTLCASSGDESRAPVDESTIDPRKLSRHTTERQQLLKSTTPISTDTPSEYVFELNNGEGQSHTGSNRRRKRMRQETSSPTPSSLGVCPPVRKRAKNGSTCVRCKLFKEKVRYFSIGSDCKFR